MPESGASTQEASVRVTEQALAALQRGATLLTPNVRAARQWAGLYDAAARQRGERSWLAAAILPWRAWAAALWQDAVIRGLDSRVLLNDLQERTLWQRAMAESTKSLAAADAQARLCMGATHLLGSYDVNARFAGGTYRHDVRSADGKTFQQWFIAFERICAEGNYLPASHLDIELAANLRKGDILKGGEFLLCGIHSPTPAQASVLAALQSKGATITVVSDAVARQTPPSLLRSESARDELRHCAEWAREQLGQQHGRRLAIVVPDLPALRAELERELRAAVASETADVTRPERSAPYEFSVGRPMLQLPMVRDAMRLLQWCAGEASVLDVGAIFRSPYLALAGSSEAGTELDLSMLRKLPLLRRSISLADAAAVFERYAVGDRLSALEQEARGYRLAQHTYAWFADGTRILLEAAGWPGPGELHSEEFQAVDRWHEVLDRLATLDLLGSRTDFASFMQQLASVARDTLFAPENLGAPVQVLTLAEAAGSTFDALWFLHAHANTWPPRLRQHALLPWRLQQDMQMPGVDPSRDEASVRAELIRLLESTGEARFSWSPDSADEAAGSQRPSPLVEQVVEQAGGWIGVANAFEPENQAGPRTTTEPDLDPLPALIGERVRGGAGLLKAQAQCGFRAFAEKRLFAAPMEQQDAGLSPGERGEQVHKVLEHFWNRVKDQRTLKEMSKHHDESGTTVRDAFLRECIARVFQTENNGKWESAYLYVQQQRLFRLLSDWLNFEAGRQPFEVLGTEKKLLDVPVGPLRLAMRVDRVDRVFTPKGDSTILIDYKTGPIAANQWLGERPDEPQLPVYAVAGAGAAGLASVGGIAFAGVRVGKDNLKLEGLGEQQFVFKNKPRKAIPFDDQLLAWSHDLNRLATAFAEGDASVDPKEYPATCLTCAQRMLCRVDSAALLQIDDLDDAEEEGAAWS